MSPRKPRFERQLPQERRQALIEATIESLKRYGHEGLSVRRISAQAGVSIGLINHHFPKKDTLIAQAYRYFNSQLVGGVRAAALQAPAAARARLRAFFKATFSPPNLDRDVSDGLGGVLGHVPSFARDSEGPRRDLSRAH